jgi:hemerythrin-like domain-containing protein
VNIDATAPTDKPETAQMIVIHQALRREFSLLPALVDAVDPAENGRSTAIAKHAQLTLDFLHEHHDSEDRLLWPLLRHRAPLKDSLIETMERQHQTVDSLITAITPDLGTWAVTGDPTLQKSISDRLDLLQNALDEHLVQEENSVLPLIHQHITVAEWTTAENAAQDNGPGGLRQKLTLAGMVLEDATPPEQVWFLRIMPTAGRVMWHAVGRRQYHAYTQSIRRNLTPAGMI